MSMITCPATGAETKELIFRVYNFHGLTLAQLDDLKMRITNHFYKEPELNGSLIIYAEIAGPLTPQLERLEAFIGQLRTISPSLRFAVEVVFN